MSTRKKSIVRFQYGGYILTCVRRRHFASELTGFDKIERGFPKCNKSLFSFYPGFLILSLKKWEI